MPYLFLLVALLIGFFLLWPVLQKANPSQIARGAALAVLIISSAVAIFGLTTGSPQWVIIGLIIWLVSLISRLAIPASGLSGAGGASGGGRRWGRKGGASSINTRYLSMSLDHGSGRVTGEVVAGRHEGRRIESMTTEELIEVIDEAAVDDPQTAQLLEAYLDRIDPNWRNGAGGGQGRSGWGGSQQDGGRIRMSREDALRVLGLTDRASDADIRAAHRKLMREHHPDRGGSAEFAAKLNEAKEVLLDQS